MKATRPWAPSVRQWIPAATAICLGLWVAVPARADDWTDRAGHVVKAQLVAVEGDYVVLRSPGSRGRTWRLRLASLKPADQARARAQAGTEPIPSGLSERLRQAEEDIRRAAQYLQGGRIDREQYAARCAKIRQRFDYLGRQELKDRGQESSATLLVRLRQRLDQVERGSVQ